VGRAVRLRGPDVAHLAERHGAVARDERPGLPAGLPLRHHRSAPRPRTCRLRSVADPARAAADETETTDLSRTPTHEPIFRQLLARQAEIGLSVFQTNHSDIEDDASCITVAQMDAKYRGFLGPRCGVKP